VSSQVVLVKIETEILLGQCTFGEAMKQPSWQQITDQRTLKKNRDLDRAHAIGRGRNRVGGSTDALSSYVQQNRHDMSTDQDGYGGVPRWCLDPAYGYHRQICTCRKQHVKHTFKQWNLDRLNKMSMVAYLGVEHVTSIILFM